MGVAGTGKSTVAGLLAGQLNWELQEEMTFIRRRMSRRCRRVFR
jgi:shikimate kinase